MNGIAVSIIIVNYKTPDLLFSCVQSILQSNDAGMVEIIVVDNDSNDNSRELLLSSYPQVKWIQVNYNSGFSRANNAGIKQAAGEYVLLLNSDTIIKNDFIKTLLNCYRKQDMNNKLGLLGCRIKSTTDNTLLVGTGRTFWGLKKVMAQNPIYIFLTRRFSTSATAYSAEYQHYHNHEIDFVSGACVMIKRSKVTGFDLYLDEDFFLYFEDVEWSYRVKRNGFYNYFCSDAEVYHLNCGSSIDSEKKLNQIQVSSYLYLFKTNSLLTYRVIGWIWHFNYAVSMFLSKRKGDVNELQATQNKFLIFKEYFSSVPRRFKKKASSSSKFLIYD